MRARRDFLRQLVPAGVLGAVALNTDWLDRVVSAGAGVADRTAAEPGRNKQADATCQ